MLTSTKRRILNVICVTLAIVSVSYGLVLRYDNSNLENLMVQGEVDNQEEVNKETTPVIKEGNLFTNPN